MGEGDIKPKPDLAKNILQKQSKSHENVEWDKISTNINSVATVFEELKDNFKEHQEKFNGYKKEVIKLEKQEKQEKVGDIVVKKEEVGGKEGKEGRRRAKKVKLENTFDDEVILID